MAHGMEQSDRMYAVVVEGDAVRQAPWHMGEGTNVTQLDAAPATRMERMIAAGQAWTVGQEAFYRQTRQFGIPLGAFEEVPGHRLLIRGDNDALLDVAGSGYEVVQNVVGHELFEALGGAADLFDGTGGTVYGGKGCYLSALINEPSNVIGDPNPTYPHLVVTWWHEVGKALTARRTTFRPVCANTISFGEAESQKTGREFTFRHTKNVLDRVEQAKAVIEGTREDHSLFIELANELAAITISDDVREQFIRTFIAEPTAMSVISDRVRSNIDRDRGRMRRTFDSPTIPEFHRNTGYGLLLAGVEYLDHLRNFRNQNTYITRTLLRDEPLKKALVPLVRELVKA